MGWIIPALWIAWTLYWWWSASDVKATVRHEPAWSRLAHLLPLTVAALLVGLPSLPFAGLDTRLLPRGPLPFWTGTAIVAAGLLFAVWARRVIGRNWSGTVTVKDDHDLVRTGPYAHVRHPIYTGLILAFVGCAIANGEARGALAVLIAGLALWRKLKLEERWMTETFGEAYARYRSEVAALIPFVL